MLEREVMLTINDDLTLGFPSVHDMKEFIHSEMKFWGWLKSLPHEFIPAGHKLYEVVIDRCWRNIFDVQLEQNPDGAEFKTVTSIPVLLSSSADAQLIDKIKERFGTIAGFMAVVFINTPNRHAMIEHQIIKNIVEIPGLEYDRTAAIQSILAYQNSDSLIVNSNVESLRARYKEFDKRHEDVMSKMSFGLELFGSHAEDLKKELDRRAAKVDYSIDRRVKLWLGIAKKTSAEAKTKMESAQNSLSSAKDAYLAQIDLSDSVKHWEDRKKHHEHHKLLWLTGVIGSMLTTFFSIILYFKYGGMIELSGTPTTSDATNISAAVTQISGALLLITLMGIIIRITLRQFNSHSHLALESQERIIFTKTYLTLMRDGKLDSELDRRLVLESLFRPTQAGGAAEITFSPPMELIYKAISEQRK